MNRSQKGSIAILRSGHCHRMMMTIALSGDITDLPPTGYIQFEYRIAESLDYREGHLFRLWYEMLRKDEKTYWHICRAKAEQRIEYKWDDFIADKKAGNLPAEVQYEPVVDFDPRFHYYDAFKDTVEDLPDASY